MTQEGHIGILNGGAALGPGGTGVGDPLLAVPARLGPDHAVAQPD